MNTMNIGAVIKKMRQEQGMVQEQVAEYLNVSTQAVSRWETGSALPDITQVPALANLFNCSADMLLGVDIALKKEHIAKIEKEAHRGLKSGISKNIAPFSRSQYLLERIVSENIFSHFPTAEIDAVKEDLQKSATPAV